MKKTETRARAVDLLAGRTPPTETWRYPALCALQEDVGKEHREKTEFEDLTRQASLTAAVWSHRHFSYVRFTFVVHFTVATVRRLL